MDISYELKYHQQEQKHYWFKARRHMLSLMLKDLNADKHLKILDLGCSGGELVKTLGKEGYQSIYGVDISKKAIGLCKDKGLKNVFIMDAARLNFNDGEFDFIIASDVLEHMENENLALAEWNRLLKPTGRLILFVPAFNFMWSRHDLVNHHYRRYSKPALLKVLQNNKFEVSKHSYWGLSLFFPAVAARIIWPLFSKNKYDDIDNAGSITNEIITSVLKFENSILRWLNFPFGTSIFAIAGKKGEKKT